MEELKFRSWTGKRFIYWGVIDEKFISPPYSDDKLILEIDRYTGEKDINGKEIYEGDIVKNTDGYRWFKEEVKISKFHGIRIGRHSATEIDYFNAKIEVIGNKYEKSNKLK